MKLTPEQLCEIAERRKQVDFTGKWTYIPEGDIVYGGDIPVAEEIGHVWEGEFIAASYSDIPALLAHIAALEAENAQMREIVLREVNNLNLNADHCTIAAGREAMRYIANVLDDALKGAVEQ